MNKKWLVGLLGGVIVYPALAQNLPLTRQLNDCKQLAVASDRLACYDEMAQHNSSPPVSANQLSSPPGSADGVMVVEPKVASVVRTPSGESLAHAWDLDGLGSSEIFTFRPYRPNYFMPVWSMADPNDRPYSPTRGVGLPDEATLNHTEAKFQLSFKTKMWENMFDTPLNLWFAYTQQSHWQVYNKDHSSPFRETNYEPEVILTFPLPESWAWGDTRLRMGGVGLVHQSNGRADPLSRSWNRLYAMTALDNGPFALVGRWWYRLPENIKDDDNPDIVDYLGHGDLQAIYKYNRHTFSALVRPNFNTGKTGVKLDWTFPLISKLRGYIQIFDGYGESMIDYNARMRGVGIGLALTEWLAY
ncbi:phospholipase A [Neisseriaceae bacterium TC5R-5]|nr:phospholipase A [Neisseriaceae bacterium TC5R-5]